MAIGRGIGRALKKFKTNRQKQGESFAKLPKSQQEYLKKKQAQKAAAKRAAKPKMNADIKEDIRQIKNWHKHGLIDRLPDFSKMDFSKMGKNVGIMGLLRMAEAAPKKSSSKSLAKPIDPKKKAAMKKRIKPHIEPSLEAVRARIKKLRAEIRSFVNRKTPLTTVQKNQLKGKREKLRELIIKEKKLKKK